MKIFGMVLIVTSFALVAHAASNRMTDSIQVKSLMESKESSRIKGIADAARDYSNSTYRIEVYGLRVTGKDPKAEYLKEKYNVQVTAVSGCCVSDQILGHAEGYNTRMKELLALKFGKDVFQEVEELWKSGKLFKVAPAGGTNAVPESGKPTR